MPEAQIETGLLALHTALGLPVPLPYVRSWISTGTTRREEVTLDCRSQIYPKRFAHVGALLDHLRFALKHEPLDQRVLAAVFAEWGREEITAWVRSEPTGGASRRAWFLYETLTGERLDLPDTTRGAYVAALDPDVEYVASRRNSPRHRVVDNLLGNGGFSVTVRRTDKLEAYVRQDFPERAQAIMRQYDPDLLARAISFLYTKETLSSFQIEREHPDKAREARFVSALRSTGSTDLLRGDALRQLQRQIVGADQTLREWRDDQVYVGETVGPQQERIHFIAPASDEVPRLMQDWEKMARRLLGDRAVDPVLVAAVVSFAFVFIHPFPDGNGRLHRFLIHHLLDRRKYTPPEGIFPVSASMLRDKRGYDEALETFSRGVMGCLDYDVDPEDLSVTLRGTHAHLYRHFDATALVEYLYSRIEDTIQRDLATELNWLSRYDQIHRLAYALDLPDQQARKLARYLTDQQGRLSNNKRPQFDDVPPEKLARVEAKAREIFAEERS